MKRLPKRNYTLEFKQEAIRRVEVEGKRQTEVARELGIITVFEALRYRI